MVRSKRASTVVAEEPVVKEVFRVSSISRGVFAFKKGQSTCKPDTDQAPSSKSAAAKRGKRKRPPQKSKQISDDTTDTVVDPRNDVYCDVWTRASSVFQDLQRQMFSDVIATVVDFTKKRSPAIGDSCSIPTCTLLTGVNLPDHEDLFGLLKADLRSHVSPHVASLRVTGTGCVSLTQKGLVQSTVAQLMQIRSEEQEDDFDEEDEEGGLELKKANMIFPVLQAWYANQYPREGAEQTRGSPKKRVKMDLEQVKRGPPPLIVILEDFESFTAPVLQDFIMNIVENSASLPFVLIFGVATSVTAIHQKLPHHITAHLSIEKYSGQKSTEMLSQLIERIIVDSNLPFKLGGRCLAMLLQIFILSDFSMKRFLAGYKYCLLEHYSSCRVAPMLCASRSVRQVNVGKLSTSDLDLCRSLVSFRKYVEEDVKGRAKLLVDDRLFRLRLQQGLDELDAATKRFNYMVSVLFELTKDLPKQPLGKQLYSVYRTALETNLVESHEYREAYELWKHLAANNLRLKLQSVCDVLEKGSDDERLSEICQEFQRYLQKLDDIANQQIASASTPLGRSKPDSLAGTPETPKNRTKMSREELQKQLLEHTKDMKKHASPYEALRTKILEYLHRVIKQHLVAPTKLPFCEIKFFDRITSVQRHLMAFPRGVIKTALEDPIVYLEDAGLEIETRAEIPPTFPDVSVAFKLHSEMGTQINLYDWLQSWLSIVHDSEREDGEESNLVLQAKFTEAVSALQFLGFVKPSKRKTDHLAKLTWGE